MGNAISIFSASPGTISDKANPADANGFRKFVDTLRYGEQHEETRLMCNSKKKGHSFVKEVGLEDENDWKCNHYLRDAAVDEAYGIIFTSYDNMDESSPFGRGGSQESETKVGATPMFRFYLPSTHKVPEMPQEMREYLENLRRNNRAELQDCDELIEVLDRLSADDLPNFKGLQQESTEFANAYWAAYIAEEQKQLFKRLHEWWMACDDDEASELVLGLAHVRKLFTVKGKKAETKLLNGPLLEVTLEATMDEDGSILLFPQKGARVKPNIETLNALISSGVGNTRIVSELREAVAAYDPASIDPWKPETYISLVQKACALHWNSEKVKSSNEPNIHDLPDDPDAMVVTTAACLYLRPKRSTVYSRDCAALAKALEDGTMKLPTTAPVLTQGPVQSKTEKEAKKISEAEDLPLPLCASKAQRRIINEFFSHNYPVLVLQGPPGTGKTHTGVSFAAVELSGGGTVLVTSNNSRALKAFVEKLPPQLRIFCIDMASCVDGGWGELHKNLEIIQLEMREILQRREEFENTVKKCEQEIACKKMTRSEIDQGFESERSRKEELIQNDVVKRVVMFALQTRTEESWIISCALELSLGEIDKTLEGLQTLIAVQADRSADPLVEFDGCASPELLEYVTAQAGEAPTLLQSSSGSRLVSTFVVPATPAVKTELSKLKVNGEAPSSMEQWKQALCGLRLSELRTKFRAQATRLEAQGCPLSLVYAEDGVTARKGFVGELQKSKELRKVLDTFPAISDVTKETLKEILLPTSKNRASQADRSKLTAEIESLESELVIAKIMLEHCKSHCEEDSSRLNQLIQLVGKLKDSDASGNSERATRRHEDFVQAFQSHVGAMRFLVMTTDQVCRYMPHNRSRSLTILDEASQSDCTAVTLLPRTERIVVVGDENQVTQNEQQWSEEAIQGLASSLPDIPSAQQLSPGNSFFDVVKVAFPGSFDSLKDHFRCPPKSIAWSSETAYHGRLDTYKPPSKESSMLSIRVEGKRDSKKKTNQVECDKIVQLVYDLIKETVVQQLPVRSIGIVSMGGPDQSKLIDTSLEEKLDSLRIKYGPQAVDRHNILKGESSKTLQGAERDMMYLSAVYDPSYVYSEIDKSRRDMWNVAMSRQKTQVILVHSYDIQHIKNPNDVKRGIFSKFLNARITNNPGLEQRNEMSLRDKVEANLISSLCDRGFWIKPMEGNVWNNALCIRLKDDPRDTCALICTEHHGESKETWAKICDQQVGLERTQTPCLRVDFLSLALNFQSVLGDVLGFLKEVGLPELLQDQKPPSKEPAEDKAHSVSDPSDSESASLGGRKRRAKMKTTRASAKRRRAVLEESEEE